MQEETALLNPYPEIMTKEQIKGFINDWIAPAASVIVVIAAILGMVRYFIRNEVSDIRMSTEQLKKKVDSLSSEIEKTDTKLDAQIQRTNDRIDKVLSEALDRAFPKPSASKESIRSSLGQMRQILQLAKDENVKLNPKLIAVYGNQVLSVANDPRISNEAWNVLGGLLNYRSVLNVENSPVVHEEFAPVLPGGWEITARFSPHLKKGQGIASLNFMYANKIVPGDQSFIYEPLNRQEIPLREGHPFVRVTAKGDLTFAIDDYRLRNVIFDGVKVEYDGGPLIMENVYFVNCIFEIKPTNSSRQFTLAVLQNVPVTFSAS